MDGAESQIEEHRDHRRVLRFEGEIDEEDVPDLWRAALHALSEGDGRRLSLDLAKVTSMDSTGVAMLRKLDEEARRRGVDLSVENVAPNVKEFLDYVGERASARREAPARGRRSFVARFGGWVVDRVEDVRDFVEFTGDVAVTLLTNLFHPRRLRPTSILYQVKRAGADGMLLIGVLSALMGFIMAFQFASGLESFSAAIYVADVVVLSTTREMGPLLAGVVMAGRSGAGLAAEIGTMKVNDELDALSVMGFPISGFLLLPRILALVVAGPLLTMLANAAGLVGGAVVGIGDLHITLAAYVRETGAALTSPDLVTGMIKGVVFGAVIGVIGCYCGTRVGREPESVGTQATSAVVSGILFVVVADSVLTALFQLYGY